MLFGWLHLYYVQFSSLNDLNWYLAQAFPLEFKSKLVLHIGHVSLFCQCPFTMESRSMTQSLARRNIDQMLTLIEETPIFIVYAFFLIINIVTEFRQAN